MPRKKYKEAAGIKAKKGKPATGRKPTKTELQNLYIEESKSIREVADQLGCSKDMVFRALLEYEIERRPHSRESKLSKYSLKELRNIVSREGYRGAARTVGVGYSTLRIYLKRREKIKN